MGVKNKIKELRKQNHITQVEMAKVMHAETIVAIENHHYNPSLELSLKLPNILE